MKIKILQPLAGLLFSYKPGDIVAINESDPNDVAEANRWLNAAPPIAVEAPKNAPLTYEQTVVKRATAPEPETAAAATTPATTATDPETAAAGK